MHSSAASITVTSRLERWRYKHPFRITGYEWTETEVLYVELERGGARGRGECSGVYYKGDLPEHCFSEVERVRGDLERGVARDELLQLLPPGGARNAIDCALWDLEAKEQRRPVWQLAGLQPPRSLVTTYTIGADDPEGMAERARAFSDARALKLKLTGSPEDAERVRAVRRARPDAWLAVDGNQGFNARTLDDILPVLRAADVRLIEQPFPVDRIADMDGLVSPIPVAADESAQTLDDLPQLENRFDIVNIKLDKCGGLTAGLQMAARARDMGLGVMVGNMAGTSLAMAPAFLIGQFCDVVDLDGPLLLESDRSAPAQYTDGQIFCSEAVWGGAEELSG